MFLCHLEIGETCVGFLQEAMDFYAVPAKLDRCRNCTRLRDLERKWQETILRRPRVPKNIGIASEIKLPGARLHWAEIQAIEE